MEELALVKKAKVCFSPEKEKNIQDIYRQSLLLKGKRKVCMLSDETQQKMKLHPAFRVRMDGT